MRIWIDMTAPAHPVVFRPIIRLLREAGHEVEVTARDYAQNIPLLERMGMEHTAVGPGHGGATTAGKAKALAARTWNMRKFAAGKRFDLAVAHGSNDLALAAASLRIPAVNTFDYEFAVQQHTIGCRLARRVMTPDTIPPARLERFGVGPAKLVQYAGLKEEYYLSDFTPDESELQRLGVDRDRVVVIVRPPPDVSLYHRKSNRLFPRVLEYLGRREDVTAIVIPRTEAQRDHVLALGLGARDHDRGDVLPAPEVLEHAREQPVGFAVVQRHIGRRADDHDDLLPVHPEFLQGGRVGREVREVVLLLEPRVLDELARPHPEALEALRRDRVRRHHAAREPAADVVLLDRELVVEGVDGRDPQRRGGEREVGRASCRERV